MHVAEKRDYKCTRSLTVVRRCSDHLYDVHLGRWG